MSVPYNVFNISVNGDEVPRPTAEVLKFPCKTLVGDSSVTSVSVNLVASAHVNVSSGETHSEADLNTKNLKDSISSAIIAPFLTHYNKRNGTKFGASGVKGIVIDGETPLESIAKLKAEKCHAIIRDPRQTEVRILLG